MPWMDGTQKTMDRDKIIIKIMRAPPIRTQVSQHLIVKKRRKNEWRNTFLSLSIVVFNGEIVHGLSRYSTTLHIITSI